MKLHRLEALRGFAAFYVVLHHSLPHTINFLSFDVGYLFRFGQEAVILFFLISGFVINYSYQINADKSLKTYLIKRGTRIYIPLMFVMMLGYFIDSWHAGILVDPQIKNLVLNLLMFQDVGSLKPNVIVEPYFGNIPLWSLSYEWWFYLLFFPLVKIFRNGARRDLLVYFVGLFSAFWYVINPDFGSRILMYFLIWWAGVVISDGYLLGSFRIRKILPILISISLVSLFLSFEVVSYLRGGKELHAGTHPVLELRHFIFSLLVISSSLAWRRLGWMGFDAIFGPFLILAPISYTLYISHYYLVAQAGYASGVSNPIVEWVIYFLVACLFCYVVEINIYPRVRRIISKQFFEK